MDLSGMRETISTPPKSLPARSRKWHMLSGTCIIVDFTASPPEQHAASYTDLRRSQYHLPTDSFVQHFVQRLGRALERIRGVDMRLHLALQVELQQRFVVTPVALGLVACERAPKHADDRAAFEQREIERDLRNVTRGEPDDEKTPVPRHVAQRRLGIRSANRIVDDIHAAAL